ncbi:hypothetical protein [Propionimicrobium sp. PCR01-08-3]|uniref:hypothetical protein n=1 Tax=Propionimicrobium sp. PCR01-08-3 TaxID=3052086 RepID=UPI00255C9970|nr:hypothetical protein [Propionimicrobium sp. PCR01-08-3]WIY81999.1 hypothetical protein QQ658_10810 [Propionimicrobium sp. PCR01-08-3]
MSTLERRLQILLDEQRYQRIAAEAERRGGSVASVVRDAIDLAFPPDQDLRIQAVGRLLGHDPSGEAPDLDDRAWAKTREAMENELIERFS